MDSPRRPRKALLPARGAEDNDTLVQTRLILGHAYLESILQRLPLTFFSSLQNHPVLPTANPRLDVISTQPPPKDTTGLLRRTPRRLKGAGNDKARARIPTPPQNDDDISKINGQDESANEDWKYADTSPENILHAARINQVEYLRSVLDPMFAEDASPIVLLCLGEKSNCTIAPIKVSNTEDEVNAWSEINRGWYSRKGHWRKHIPGFNVTGVDVVDISILDLKEAPKGRQECEYIGMYTEDIAAKKQKLQHFIDNFVSTSSCIYNCYTGQVVCLDPDCLCSKCHPGINEPRKCELQKYYNAKQRLSHLNTLPLMKHAFSNPALAASNSFLHRAKLVYCNRDILLETNRWYRHCPDLRELKFRGIVIREGWTFDTRKVVLPLLANTFLIVVVSAKVVFGWETAWTVGSFFVALVTLLWMCANSISS